MGKLLVLLLSILSVTSIYADERKVSDVNNKDFSNQTALHDAVRIKSLNVVKFLVGKNVDINAKDRLGYTPLHLAVRYSDDDIFNYLLQKKADINIEDMYGETPLIDAVRNNDTKIAKALICSKANRDISDQYGTPVVQYAKKNSNTYVKKLLLVDYPELYCQSKIKISINKQEENQKKKPLKEVCGKIDIGYVADVSLTLENKAKKFGPYKAEIDNEDHTWCAKIEEEFTNGYYKVVADAKDYVVNKSTAKSIITLATPIAVEIEKVNEIHSFKPQVCGIIKNTKAKSVRLMVSPEDKEDVILGTYLAKVDNKKMKWCANVTKPLMNKKYIFTAKAEDKKGIFSIDKRKILLSSPIAIEINPAPIYNDNTPEICGRVLRGKLDKLKLFLVSKKGKESKVYNGKINNSKQSWCVQVKEELKNGNYQINAIGFDKDKNVAKDKRKVDIHRISGLFEALFEEFKDDFSTWGAELDRDTLTFRFKEQSSLFNVGASRINSKFRKILNDFFPRYIKVIINHKDEIKSVNIEGHSSSEHALGRNEQHRYELNRQLSQKRADSVMKNAELTNNKIIKDNSKWLNSSLQAIGKSHSNLIYNKDGSENKKLSRRIEFVIITKGLSLFPMVDDELSIDK